jgi:hypothetical protein
MASIGIGPWLFKALSHYVDLHYDMIETTPADKKYLVPGRGTIPSGGWHDGYRACSIMPLSRRRSFPELFIILQDSLYIPPALGLFSELDRSSAMWLKLTQGPGMPHALRLNL